MDKKRPILRRGFLSLIGAAPFAAKGLVEGALPGAAQASAVSVVGEVGRHGGLPIGGGGRISGTRKLLGRLIRSGELPDFKKQQFWRQALRSARMLDPDLASMRSIALSQKVRLQAERNYRALLADYVEQIDYDTAWAALRRQVLGREPSPDDDDYWD